MDLLPRSVGGSDNWDIGPKWVEVDTGAITHNLRQVRSILSPEVKVMAVVKADAYGCGALPVARALEAEGVDMFGVTTVAEGLELREAGVKTPIFVFQPVLPDEMECALFYYLTLTLAHFELLDNLREAVRRTGQQAAVHLKVDTGLGRLGVTFDQIERLVDRIKEKPGIEVQGVYSHLARAGSPLSLVQGQCLLKAAEKIVDAGLNPGLRHISSSGSVVRYPQLHFDMVRLGTVLYGQYPHTYSGRRLDLRDPWQAKARVVQVRDVPRGLRVGYGCAYKTRRATRLAVLAVGYGDGLGVSPRFRSWGVRDAVASLLKWIRRHVLGKPENTVELNGRLLPLVGRIGMQMVTADTGGHRDVRVGDTAFLNLRRLTANPRLPRLYLKEGRPYLLRTVFGERQLTMTNSSLPPDRKPIDSSKEQADKGRI